MPMRADLWFPQIVWKDTITNMDNAAIKAHVLETKNTNQGKTASNQLGWQSEDYFLDSGKPPQVEHMIRVLDAHVKDCARQASLPPLRICNFWFNVNPKGSYNTLHNHQDSILSGVYYIDIPDENMGNIEFHRDDEAQYYIPENLDRYTQFTSTKATYKPETGLLLIFPSWLKHFVQGNQSEHLRISMSFNTELDIQK
jgi:uncharacterized protein (TIGR02466 family)